MKSNSQRLLKSLSALVVVAGACFSGRIEAQVLRLVCKTDKTDFVLTLNLSDKTLVDRGTTYSTFESTQGMFKNVIASWTDTHVIWTSAYKDGAYRHTLSRITGRWNQVHASVGYNSESTGQCEKFEGTKF